MRRMHRLLWLGLLATLFGTASVWAQTTCKTSNCAAGKDGAGNPSLPAECENIASPRTLDILMTNSPTLSFQPSSLRIEGESLTPGVPWSYQCIRWHKADVGPFPPPWHSSTEDTTGSSCSTSTTCSSSNITPPCDWETGNIDDPLEWSVCHYGAVAPGTYSFRCRLHFIQGMVGSLTIVEPIGLQVNKDGAGNPVLEWSMGGVGPWNVFRDTTPDMPAPANLAPGTTSRTLTDTTAPGQAFYLVVEAN